MLKQNKNFDYSYYGTKSTPEEVVTFIDHLLSVNQKAERDGRKRTPICIWGSHGIGKTEVIETYALDNGFDFKYIAPAQFEEMGDLLGMPKIVDGKTVFVAPEWVPQEPGPGILLIDDVNRADDRILRGIMQLLQNYELISWRLPRDWHIILTANPEGGDYSVTPMDDAMITRMMHITMTFDIKSWSKWATLTGIDQRGIAFANLYPEIISGGRTTPRTLVQFFESIANISNLSEQINLVQMLADASLDEATATAFIAYINNHLSSLIWPEEILHSNDFKIAIDQRLKDLVLKDAESSRIDILATICNRLINYITLTEQKIDSLEIQNLQKFLLLDILPNDLRLGMLQDIVISDKPELKQIPAHPKLAMLLLSKM